MQAFAEYTLVGLTVGSFYALATLGYTIVYGIVRLINFAHGNLVVLGAFMGWTLLSLPFMRAMPAWASVLIAFTAAMLAAAALSVIILRVAYAPVLSRSAFATLITALGMSLVIQYTTIIIWGPEYQAYPALLPSTGITVGGVFISNARIVLVAAAVVLMIALYLWVEHTTMGTAMRALALDHQTARLVGINVNLIIAVAFAVSGGLGAAAGVMIGLYYTQISFNLGFSLSLKLFTAAVLGGIGSIQGAMVGGVLIGLLEAYTSGYLSGRWQDVIVFGILIAVLVLRPRGIFGERVAQRM